MRGEYLRLRDPQHSQINLGKENERKMCIVYESLPMVCFFIYTIMYIIF
jgi:hypothetical protein